MFPKLVLTHNIVLQIKTNICSQCLPSKREKTPAIPKAIDCKPSSTLPRTELIPGELILHVLKTWTQMRRTKIVIVESQFVEQ